MPGRSYKDIWKVGPMDFRCPQELEIVSFNRQPAVVKFKVSDSALDVTQRGQSKIRCMNQFYKRIVFNHETLRARF